MQSALCARLFFEPDVGRALIDARVEQCRSLKNITSCFARDSEFCVPISASEGIPVTRNLAAQPLVRFWILDASLAGLDPRELITIQSLPDLADWESFEATRKALGPNLTHRPSAARYGPSRADLASKDD